EAQKASPHTHTHASQGHYPDHHEDQGENNPGEQCPEPVVLNLPLELHASGLQLRDEGDIVELDRGEAIYPLAKLLEFRDLFLGKQPLYPRRHEAPANRTLPEADLDHLAGLE